MLKGLSHHCNVCGTDAGSPIYQAESGNALTSLCEIRPGNIKVWLCEDCGHLFGEPLADVEAFYEDDYKILLNDEEEDQIYEERDGNIVYRTDHQMAVMDGRISLAAGARILDYGCAKATMARRLAASRPDIGIHLFDVSHIYLPYWQLFAEIENTAIHQTPDAWNASFDMVMSFFAFEHIPDPAAAMNHVASLLRDGGQVYGIVPHVFDNIADLVVIDHVNHFTTPSITRLLSAAGFGSIAVDTTSHRGGLIFSAVRNGEPIVAPGVGDCLEKARGLAGYWSGIDQSIRRQEKEAKGAAAIYGSGFYGSYILNALSKPEDIACFIDKNPFLQGRSLFSKPILPPAALPSEVRTLYAGLNPAQARGILSAQDWMKDRDLDIVYLDGGGGS